MSDYLEEDFGFLVGPTDRIDRGPQATLASAERTLDLSPLPIDAPATAAPRRLPKAADHLPPVLRLRPLATASPVQRDHRGPHAELFAARGVVGLRVVSRIGQQRVDGSMLHGRPHDRDELRRILTRRLTDGSREEHMGPSIDHHGQFRPAFLANRTSALDGEVAADGFGVVPGSIDGGPQRWLRGRIGGDARGLNYGVEVFFLRRVAAFWSVV